MLKGCDNVIICKDLCKEYKLEKRAEPVSALKCVTLSEDSEFYPVKKGEFVMIRGPSGGGKTTLLNLLGTIDAPTSGTINILGSAITSQSDDSFLSLLRLRHIGFVFQSFNLLATMTAFENVELPMNLLNEMPEKERKIRTKQLLTGVGLRDRMDHLPSELSGGEQQRVAIARALANGPDILLLDEPTGDLDSRSTIEIMNLLLNINRYGPKGDGQNPTTCVMVTHNPDIECYADRILYVQDGVFVKQSINLKQIALKPEEYTLFMKLDAQEGRKA
jgi:putative ABC transport system ATP-binding protein